MLKYNYGQILSSNKLDAVVTLPRRVQPGTA
jgi:hypothetical protein